MPTETIVITVTGANPQTKNVAINVNATTGSGSTSVTFTGVNSGQDTFVAAGNLANTPYTSNSAFVAWQATNGTVSLVSNLLIAGYDNPGANPTWYGVGTAFTPQQANQNTVVVNQVYTNGAAGTGVPITGLVTDDGNTGQYKHVPILIDSVKSDGTALTPLGTPLGWGQPDNNGEFVTFFQGQIVVAQAGIETFYFLVDDSWALYVGGGATRVAGAYTTAPSGTAPSAPSTASAAVTGTSLSGVGAWPLVGTRNTAAISVQPTDYVYVNFPSPGIYPFLAWWVNASGPQTYFQMTYSSGQGAIPPSSGNGESGGVIKPVALQAAPPATSPSGNLQLSLAQSNVQIQGSQITLNITVTGITYTTKQYIPLFEGTAGKLFIYNNTSGTFAFQTYNGSPVDNASAASNVFSLSGNTQNLLSVQYNQSGDGRFSLYYAGGPFPAGIAASTQLTVTADDIAWFASATKSYDVFAPASLGGPGGISFAVEVDYMVNPTSYAVSPTSVTSDGNSHVFTVTLSKPMSPQQIGANSITGNSVSVSITANNGATVGAAPTAQYNTSGFLTGWTVPITVPKSNTNGSFQIAVTLTGVLSYLSGTAFVSNGPVTYINNVATTIALNGLGYSPPVPYSFTVNPNTATFTSGGAPSPTGIRRATWGSGLGSGNEGPGANTAGNVITIYGEGRGTVFPSNLVVGGQVTLSGFINPFPDGSGITGQSGSSQAGPLEYYNINGTYAVTQITTAIIGGNESTPVFTITAPAVGGPTRSYDWGSSVNPPDGGWFFLPLGASTGNPTLTAAVYTLDNNPVTLTFQYKNIATGVTTNIGTGSLTGTSTGTVSGATVYFSTYTLSFVPPGQPQSGYTDLIGFTAYDTVSGLSTQWFSETVFTFPISYVTAGSAITTDNGSYIQSGTTTATLYFLDVNTSEGNVVSALQSMFAYGTLLVEFSGFTGTNGPNFLDGQVVQVTAISNAHLSNHDDAYWYIQFAQPAGTYSYISNPAEWSISFSAIPAAGYSGPVPD